MPGAECSLPKHIAELWEAAAELRVAASDEPENAAALRRLAGSLKLRRTTWTKPTVVRSRLAFLRPKLSASVCSALT